LLGLDAIAGSGSMQRHSAEYLQEAKCHESFAAGC
jgi:hypothetical protein